MFFLYYFYLVKHYKIKKKINKVKIKNKIKIIEKKSIKLPRKMFWKIKEKN
jgi:hypothetical protein